MNESEWIAYFEAMNGRKPTTAELSDALKKGDFVNKMNYGGELEKTILKVRDKQKSTKNEGSRIFSFVFKVVDNLRRYFRRITALKLVKICLLLPITIIIFGSLFLVFRKEYNLSRKAEYTKLYQNIIDEYQLAINNEDDKKINSLILTQPSRNPAYALFDSNDDGKDELYISFDDFSDAYESIAVYQISWNSVEEIDFSNTSLSPEDLSSLDWTWFNVDNLLTLNVEKIYKQDLSTLAGVWLTNDENKNEIIFDNRGPYSVYGSSIRGTTTTKTNIGGLDFYNTITVSGLAVPAPVSGYISSSYVKFEGGGRSYSLVFDFIPKGIEHGDSDKNYDRVYYKGDDKYLYRSIDISSMNSSEHGNTSELARMNLTELSSGNYSSIVGKWENKSGESFVIEESGDLYWGDSVGYPLQNITINSDESAVGILNRNLAVGMTPNTRDYVSFFPAGISVPGGENAEIKKDRIGLSGTVEGYNDPQVYYRVE